jgi:hypothetical protein
MRREEFDPEASARHDFISIRDLQTLLGVPSTYFYKLIATSPLAPYVTLLRTVGGREEEVVELAERRGEEGLPETPTGLADEANGFRSEHQVVKLTTARIRPVKVTKSNLTPLLTSAEVAERLDVRPGWLVPRVRCRIIKSYRIGSRTRFDERELPHSEFLAFLRSDVRPDMRKDDSDESEGR